MMLLKLNESDVLIDIEKFVKRVVLIRNPFLEFYQDLKDRLLDFYLVYDSDCYYSALLGPFIEFLNDFEPYLDSYELLDRLEELSYFEIRRNFKRHYVRHKEQLRENYKSEMKNTRSLTNRMKCVSSKYSRILVVRVDLAYISNCQSDINIQEFSGNMKLVRNKIRDRYGIFKGLIEYSWVLEQGEDKGYHCHLLLVYKGSQHRNGYYVAKRIGLLWKEITVNKGCHFNCHGSDYLKQFSDRNALGIGMIHRNNPTEVRNMLNTVRYLVRPEKDNQYLRVKCKKRMRTFG